MCRFHVLVSVCVITSITNVWMLTSATQCPKQCSCDKDFTVRCANVDDESLHNTIQILPGHVQHLDLSGSNITQIQTELFSSFSQLKTLDLSSSNIRNIDNDTFKEVNQLEVLQLNQNHLNINVLQLQLPKSIHTVNLANNRLSGDLFPIPDWINLKQLHIQFNSITNLPANFFIHCSALQKINASHNMISLDEHITGKQYFTTNLTVLDLSWNFISKVNQNYFQMFPKLTHLFLQGNQISSLKNLDLSALVNLQHLDLSQNYFETLPPYALQSNLKLEALILAFLPNFTIINPKSLTQLGNLVQLDLSHNKKFSHLHIHSFHKLEYLKNLDLSNNALETLHQGIFTNLSNIEKVNLQGNPWSCECNLVWIFNASVAHAINFNDLICASPSNSTGKYFNSIPSSELVCSLPSIGQYSTTRFFPIGQSAVLDCQASGDPIPATIWKTPQGKTLYHHESYVSLDDTEPSDPIYHKNHIWHNLTEYPENHHKKHGDRVHVLQNGSLYFDFVMRHDAGHYICMAQNELGNMSVTISFRLDFRIIIIRTYESIIVGFVAMGFMLVIALVTGLIRYIALWCDLREHKQKRRTIRQIIESLDAYRLAKFDQISAYKAEKMDKISAYKSEKMDKISAYKSEKMGKLSAYKSAKVDQLKQAKEHTVTSLVHYLKSTREHYTQQMNAIKDNSSEQVQKLRENYSQRISRLKDYRTHQIEKIRENYHAQVTKIKEYGSTQLEKLREQYKVQQMHVLKLLELMNLDYCRGTVEAECIKTDSILFEPDIAIDIDPAIPEMQEHFDDTSVNDYEDFLTASSSSETSSHEDISSKLALPVGQTNCGNIGITLNRVPRSDSDDINLTSKVNQQQSSINDETTNVQDSKVHDQTEPNSPASGQTIRKKNTADNASATENGQLQSSPDYEISIISASVSETGSYIHHESSV